MFSRSTVKYIQSLQHKKFRDQHRAFIAEGPKVVEELLETHIFQCNQIYALQQWADTSPSAIPFKHKITIVKEHELEKIASFATPNQVLAEFQMKEPQIPTSFSGRHTLMLDEIRDPGNFGTIIRTADWFGIENIICSPGTVDMYNPKVVQSTMASLGRVNIIYTALADWLHDHKTIKSYAAVLDGKPVKMLQAIKESVLIIGNESHGVNPQILDIAGERISIPGTGKAESLNAAVAAAIIMYTVSGH